MEKATFVNGIYNESHKVELQGNRSSIKPYLNKGYYIKEDRNGYWVLVKPASLTVILRNSKNITHYFQMKEDALQYYGKNRINENLANRFISDATAGKIKFYMDDDGSYCIK